MNADLARAKDWVISKVDRWKKEIESNNLIGAEQKMYTPSQSRATISADGHVFMGTDARITVVKIDTPVPGRDEFLQEHLERLQNRGLTSDPSDVTVLPPR